MTVSRLQAKSIEYERVGRSVMHAFLAGQRLPLPTLDWNTIPDGYRGAPGRYRSRSWKPLG